MAKELPYFKFFVSEWSDGDITLENYNVQGLFINLCSYYWSKSCDITLSKAKKKFKNIDDLFQCLLDSGIIKVDSDDFISISFLDEQRDERDAKILINRENGLKGGRPKKQPKTELKPTGLISLTETKAKHKAIREEKIREDKDKIRKDNNKEIFSKIVNDYVFCESPTSSKIEWDKMSDTEKETAINHAPEYRKEMERLGKTQYQPEFNKYLYEKKYNIPIKDLTARYKKPSTDINLQMEKGEFSYD